MKRYVALILICFMMVQGLSVFGAETFIDTPKIALETEILITGNSGEEIYYIPKIGTVTATVKVSNGSGVMLLALYNEKRELENVLKCEGSELKISLAVEEIKKGQSLKVMVFESLENLKPLAKCKELYTAKESSAVSLISNNAIGGMFKDQPTIQTNAKFRFITEGVNTTEAGFLSDTSKLNDGYSQEGFYADS
ncbi:MAG: hypothetical protein RSC29_06220, partial [Oscillospiraceae bacterium]